ncbi:MerR family transcriptional regulator [Nocardia sp. CDC159]|uniref:MerR family transcriptional regulator n=1 Tax=Nocardia pulmonis TaxID=2951408 RepID=A0A9X2IXQ4_9NOCA|nr:MULTISPECIES: MerR family transcriptional regulator [Nocardia]MCM6774115.1 MerR family transcriptional regulator [Nocardia pulmonis]MCM6787002.1 MerR family transcriptional regulator [Nocardia sp. CDC159]
MPAGPSSDIAAGYTVRAVADRLGIPTATLRSWNQRYRIGPSQHRPGKHRLYTEADIATLERMLALIRAGASPAGAAAAVRGPAIEFGDRDTLLRAAFELDTTTVTSLLAKHFRDFGVADTWNNLCRPAFAELVAEQDSGVGCIDVEHHLSWCVTSVLQRNNPPPPSTEPPLIVLACTSGEHHSLPLEVLRAALAERAVPALMLGADVPTAALADTLSRHARRPTVLLWSNHESTALSETVRACLDADARVMVGGPGWSTTLLPAEVRAVGSLEAAVDELA